MLNGTSFIIPPRILFHLNTLEQISYYHIYLIKCPGGDACSTITDKKKQLSRPVAMGDNDILYNLHLNYQHIYLWGNLNIRHLKSEEILNFCLIFL